MQEAREKLPTLLSTASVHLDMVIAAVTQRADGLRPLMDARRINGSQLAAYIGKRPGTVNSWFNADTIPSPALCQLAAGFFKRPIEEALWAAGHLPLRPDTAAGDDPEMSEAVSLLGMLTADDRAFVLRTMGVWSGTQNSPRIRSDKSC